VYIVQPPDRDTSCCDQRLAYAYHVWSTSISAFVDRQTNGNDYTTPPWRCDNRTDDRFITASLFVVIISDRRTEGQKISIKL